jgi:hypothetical protein
MANLTKKHIAKYPGRGSIQASTLKNGQRSLLFHSNMLAGTNQRSNAVIIGISDDQARRAFATFMSVSEELVRQGENIMLVDQRRAIQAAIIAFLGAGTPGVVRQMPVWRTARLLPKPAGAFDPVLPLDAAPPAPAPEPAEYKPAGDLLDRASNMVAEAAGQVNLSDRAVLEAVMKIQRRADLTDEQRAATLEVLFSKASGNPLEQSPEALAAFALTDAMDKLTKGSK